MVRSYSVLAVGVLAVLAGCAAQDGEDERAPVDRCDDPGVQCQAYGRKPDETKPPAYELGTGDGSATSVTFTTVFQGPAGHQPVDLEFHPTRSRELWVVNYASSAITIITDAGKSTMRAKMVRDPAYSHFMYMPPAFAFGIESAQGYGQQWAACGDGDNGGNMFMGPTLYSSDEYLMGKQTQGGLGTHLDMLHATPYCRGLGWGGAKNVFYAFNAYNKAIDYYDFQTNHEPGGDDHSDGKIRRFWANQVLGVDGYVSHVSFDTATKKLYVADTGHARILALDPSQGVKSAPMPGRNEDIIERNYYEAPLQELVAPGTLTAPSGIEASGGLAFVTDAETSEISAFSLESGELVRKLDTGLPPGSLAGLNFGPDGKIYFVDRLENRVLRIDP